jgi:hypothetical protein
VGREAKKYTQDFDGETFWKEATWKTENKWFFGYVTKLKEL